MLTKTHTFLIFRGEHSPAMVEKGLLGAVVTLLVKLAGETTQDVQVHGIQDCEHFLYYTSHTQSCREGYRGIALSLNISCMLINRQTNTQMELCTVVVYDLRMCMKEDNPSQINIKGDNSMEITFLSERGFDS